MPNPPSSAVAELWKQYLATSPPAPTYDANEYDELRYAAYEVVFGTPDSVLEEPLATPPFAVRVLLYDPPDAGFVYDSRDPASFGTQRSHAKLVTIGMSNERMPVGAPSRVELMFLVAHSAIPAVPRAEGAIALPSMELPDLLHFARDVLMHYAKSPWWSEEPIGAGRIVPVAAYGLGECRFFDDDSMAALAVVRPPAKTKASLIAKHLRLDDDPVEMLMLVPITAREAEFARERGVDALFARGVPYVYAGPRLS